MKVSHLIAFMVIAMGCGRKQGGISPERLTDSLYAVIAADRAVYSNEVVNRLQGVIAASEHFRDEKTLPLPAQMLRFGAEAVQSRDAGFTYALLSKWPLNRQNAPRTDLERRGLDEVSRSGGRFYGEEKLGDRTYFTAVYADKATTQACASCHNESPDSPRHDFKVGDVMGGVVIRIPLAGLAR